MIAIDKKVPIPTVRLGRKLIYPFDKMEVGDSFEVADFAERNTVASAARSWAKRNKKKMEFQTAATENGKFRIWRTK